jgi:hypothetical protein
MFGFKSKSKDSNAKTDSYNFPDLDFNPELMDNDQNFDDNELLVSLPAIAFKLYSNSI